MAQEIYVFHPGVGQNRPSDGASVVQKVGSYFAYMQQEYSKANKTSFFQGAVVPPDLASAGNAIFRLVFRQIDSGSGNIYVDVRYRLLSHNPPITYPNRDGGALVSVSSPIAFALPGTIGEETKVEFSRVITDFTSGEEIILAVDRLGTNVLDTFSGKVALERVDMEFPLTDLLYTNLVPVPQTIGGVVIGDTFLDQTMQQMWDALLYPYQFPAFTAFSVSSFPTNLIEVGNSVLTPATFMWARTNSSNIVPPPPPPVDAGIFIFDLTSSPPVPPHTLGSNLPDTLSAILALFGGSPLTYLIPTTHQFQIRGKNTRVPVYPLPSGYFTRNLTLTWAFRRFYGRSILAGPLTEVQIEALANNPITAGFSGTYSFPSVPSPGQYCYICLAQAAGTPSNFIDTDTGLNVAMNAPYIVSVTNSYGVVENYDVYRTTYQIVDALDIAVS